MIFSIRILTKLYDKLDIIDKKILFASGFSIAIIILYYFNCLPPFVSIASPNMMNNCSLDSEELNTLGFRTIFGFVNIVALILSVIGLFITMLLISVGHFKHQFYDILFKIDQISKIERENLQKSITTLENEKISRRKFVGDFIDKYTIKCAKDYNNKIEYSSNQLSHLIKQFTRHSIWFLIVISIAALLEFF